MTHSLQLGQGIRLQEVLTKLEITPYQFSKDLGYKSPDTVYHVINGINGLRNNFLKRIEESEHLINIEWLLTGFGDPINYIMNNGYGSELNTNSKIIYPSELDFYFLKRLGQQFAHVLDINDDSYAISMRISLGKGIEFFYETYLIDSDGIYPDKNYSLILQPDWKISSYFDFWRVNKPSIRCQNLLELYEGVSQKFENAIFEIYSGLKKLIKDDSIKFEPNKFLKENDTFITIYSTDARINNITK